eukprot:5411504-Lingulodinium_polyedra.AAC.1
MNEKTPTLRRVGRPRLSWFENACRNVWSLLAPGTEYTHNDAQKDTIKKAAQAGYPPFPQPILYQEQGNRHETR